MVPPRRYRPARILGGFLYIWRAPLRQLREKPEEKGAGPTLLLLPNPLALYTRQRTKRVKRKQLGIVHPIHVVTGK